MTIESDDKKNDSKVHTFLDPSKLQGPASPEVAAENAKRLKEIIKELNQGQEITHEDMQTWYGDPSYAPWRPPKGS